MPVESMKWGQEGRCCMQQRNAPANVDWGTAERILRLLGSSSASSASSSGPPKPGCLASKAFSRFSEASPKRLTAAREQRRFQGDGPSVSAFEEC